MATPYPPTVLLRPAHQHPRNCSGRPRRGRPVSLPPPPPGPGARAWEGSARPPAGGPPLSVEDAGAGLLLLDGSWRWAAAMTRDFLDVPPRSLLGYQTAYPRSSKRGT